MREPIVNFLAIRQEEAEHLLRALHGLNEALDDDPDEPGGRGWRGIGDKLIERLSGFYGVPGMMQDRTS
jgi:hypothetical protein